MVRDAGTERGIRGAGSVENAGQCKCGARGHCASNVLLSTLLYVTGCDVRSHHLVFELEFVRC